MGFKAGDTVRCVASRSPEYEIGKEYTLTQGDYGPLIDNKWNGLSGDWELVTQEIDYRDGEWHRWNGGECPVHHKDRVRYETRGGAVSSTKAGIVIWYHFHKSGDVIFFRVVERYEEPVKVVQWANDYADYATDAWHDTRDECDGSATENRIAVIRREMFDGKVTGYFMEEV